jgi:hypothetical protein
MYNFAGCDVFLNYFVFLTMLLLIHYSCFDKVRLMGGEISIKDKEPGEAGTCFGLNVFLKISDAEEHIAHGRVVPSLFREPGCFKGGKCVLLVHGDETRRILQTWMENVGMKVWPVSRFELLAPTME